MIRRAFLQEKGQGRLIHEMELLRDAFTRRALPFVLFTQKELLRREFRAYVIRGRVVALDRYLGDSTDLPDPAVAEGAVRRLAEGGNAPAAFAIDVGVLSTGETAIVEVNDGFSVGAYSIDSDTYADFTVTRWEQLLGMRKCAAAP